MLTDDRMVHEAIEHRDHHNTVAEGVAATAEGEIGSDDHREAFVGLRGNPGKHVGLPVAHWQTPISSMRRVESGITLAVIANLRPPRGTAKKNGETRHFFSNRQDEVMSTNDPTTTIRLQLSEFRKEVDFFEAAIRKFSALKV